MTTPDDDDAPDLGDVSRPVEDALPPVHRGHAGRPERLDDDALAAATDQERVAAGLRDRAPGQIPPATDPLTEDSSEGSPEAAERAQRGP